MSKQTRDYLKKVASVPSLYRHKENHSYYGVKKLAGKIITKAFKKESGEPITALQEAKAALNTWLASLTAKSEPASESVGFTVKDLLPKKPTSLDDLKRIVEAARNTPTLAQCFEQFNKLKANNSPGTLEKYKYVKRAFELYGGNELLGKSVSQITTTEITAFFINFPIDKKPQYFNTFSIVVNQVFEMAKINRHIKENPLDLMPKNIRRRKVTVTRDQTPSIEQCEAIVNSIRSQKSDTKNESADLCAILHLAALGQAEANFLTWADIDFKNNVIRAKRIKTEKHFDVPIYPFLKPFLESLAAKNLDRKPTDKLFKVVNIKKALYAACERLKLPAYSPRDLRKARITWLLRNGFPIELIADAQGHGDRGVLIRRVYSNVIDEEGNKFRDEQLKKLEKRVKKKSK